MVERKEKLVLVGRWKTERGAFVRRARLPTCVWLGVARRPLSLAEYGRAPETSRNQKRYCFF